MECPRCKTGFTIDHLNSSDIYYVCTCPSCGYSTFSNEVFDICPQCAVNAGEYLRSKRRKIAAGAASQPVPSVSGDEAGMSHSESGEESDCSEQDSKREGDTWEKIPGPSAKGHCHSHPGIQADWECNDCGAFLCDRCVKKTTSRMLISVVRCEICSLCGGMAVNHGATMLAGKEMSAEMEHFEASHPELFTSSPAYFSRKMAESKAEEKLKGKKKRSKRIKLALVVVIPLFIINAIHLGPAFILGTGIGRLLPQSVRVGLVSTCIKLDVIVQIPSGQEEMYDIAKQVCLEDAKDHPDHAMRKELIAKKEAAEKRYYVEFLPTHYGDKKLSEILAELKKLEDRENRPYLSPVFKKWDPDSTVKEHFSKYGIVNDHSNEDSSMLILVLDAINTQSMPGRQFSVSDEKAERQK
jgi:hypothetical protein